MVAKYELFHQVEVIIAKVKRLEAETADHGAPNVYYPRAWLDLILGG